MALKPISFRTGADTEIRIAEGERVDDALASAVPPALQDRLSPLDAPTDAPAAADEAPASTASKRRKAT